MSENELLVFHPFYISDSNCPVFEGFHILWSDTCSWKEQLEKNEKLKSFKLQSSKCNWKE